MMSINTHNTNKGFVALFTVLIASVILAMAVGISTTLRCAFVLCILRDLWAECVRPN
jgi:hypothetical protein